MKRLTWLCLTLLTLGALASCGRQGATGKGVAMAEADAGITALEAKAQQFLDLLTRGDYSAAAKQFDAAMKSAMPADKLREAWESLQSQAGSYKRLTGKRTEEQAGYQVVLLTLEFEKATLDMKVVYDSEGKVSGLWFVPSADQSKYEAPGYVKPDAFCERESTVGGGEWKLPATLTLPVGKGPFPAVVVVQGSGPQDRDETIGPNKPFKDLAQGLASHGIAVLRYEKRTRQYPQQMAALQSITVKEEVVDDAAAAVELLRRTDGIDPKRVCVLGHSLGGMLAPRIAEAAPGVAGLIIMAGSTRPLGKVILEQVRYIASLSGPLTDEQKRRIEELEKQVQRVDSPDLSPQTPASELPLGVPASYWLDLRDYHPAQAAAKLHIPILILQGGGDYQVTEKDFEGWRQALRSRPNVEFELYPDLNHLFMEGKGKATPAEYEQPGHVAEKVVTDIVTWVKEARLADI